MNDAFSLQIGVFQKTIFENYDHIQKIHMRMGHLFPAKGYNISSHFKVLSSMNTTQNAAEPWHLANPHWTRISTLL